MNLRRTWRKPRKTFGIVSTKLRNIPHEILWEIPWWIYCMEISAFLSGAVEIINRTFCALRVFGLCQGRDLAVKGWKDAIFGCVFLVQTFTSAMGELSITRSAGLIVSYVIKNSLKKRRCKSLVKVLFVGFLVKFLDQFLNDSEKLAHWITNGVIRIWQSVHKSISEPWVLTVSYANLRFIIVVDKLSASHAHWQCQNSDSSLARPIVFCVR